MTLFTKSIDEISFEDVGQFVATWKEGVRVEYKEDITDKLPKSISSFANTLGGVMVLGVKEDKPNNTDSIVGIDKRAGIKEGIIDSSVNGIYPAILPEVKVIDIPSTTKVVVVVKVSESDLAPHSIQNSTRTYIRQDVITQLIADADQERIEHLFKRRKRSEMFRDELIGKMHDHCKVDLNQAENEKMPLIQIIISPLYPYKPIISKDQLYDFARSYSTPRGGHPLSLRSDPSRISDGVFHRIKDEHRLLYNRLNDHGCLFSIEPIDERPHPSQQDGKPYLMLYGILNPIWNCLDLVYQLYERCNPPYRGNLMVKVMLSNVANRELLVSDWSTLYQHPSHEKQISLSRQLISDELKQIHPIVKSIAREIFWAFQVDSSVVDAIIDNSLRANRYINQSNN